MARSLRASRSSRLLPLRGGRIRGESIIARTHACTSHAPMHARRTHTCMHIARGRTAQHCAMWCMPRAERSARHAQESHPRPTRAPRRSASRRFLVAWISFAIAAFMLVLASCMMLAAASNAQDGATAMRTVTVVALADIVTAAGISPMWSLHHTTQPAGLLPCSIALVNSIGNLGGFIGPVLLGSLRDRLGPMCHGAARNCTSSWGWGALPALPACHYRRCRHIGADPARSRWWQAPLQLHAATPSSPPQLASHTCASRRLAAIAGCDSAAATHSNSTRLVHGLAVSGVVRTVHMEPTGIAGAPSG